MSKFKSNQIRSDQNVKMSKSIPNFRPNSEQNIKIYIFNFRPIGEQNVKICTQLQTQTSKSVRNSDQNVKIHSQFQTKMSKSIPNFRPESQILFLNFRPISEQNIKI